MRPPVAEVGLGARFALAGPGAGDVSWAGRGGAWLRLPRGVVGLAGWAAPAGPLWARGSFPWAHLPTGAPVTVLPGGDLDVDGTPVRLASVPGWRGALPDHVDEGARELALGALAGLRPSALEGDRRVADAAAHLAAGDLRAAAGRLGGYGPGLTPAGDDVLAGILIALRTGARAFAEGHLVAVAASVLTTDISAALLTWAARGQHIEPVHRLLEAAVAGDAPGARAAAADLEAFGSSSGTDVALGLRTGLAARPPTSFSGELTGIIAANSPENRVTSG